MTPPPPLPTAATQPPQQPPPPMGQTIAPTGAFPGSLTPGWNDPPPVSTDGTSSTGGQRRPRLDLRKRVAYPMSGNPNPNINVNDGNLHNPLPPPL